MNRKLMKPFLIFVVFIILLVGIYLMIPSLPVAVFGALFLTVLVK